VTAAILDIDGTLVDSNYQHALAWHRAFRRFDRVVPVWQCHRAIGMGGDQLVAHLTDDDFEAEHGDAVREAEGEEYEPLMPEVVPLPHARELLETLKQRGTRLVLASSAKPAELEHYLDLLEARDLADGWTCSEDVEETKPEPDLVQVALQKLGDLEPDEAVMVGDSTWDCQAAERAGVRTIAVRTGGFGADELREAGAAVVFDSMAELIDGLGDTPLG
jgi:HAD superfamily hydrolase (TIGR01509 family)